MQWDKDDRDKAVWVYLRRRETCGSCGTRRSEWDPEQGGHLHAYSAERGHCRGCAELDQLRTQIQNSTDKIPGTYASLRKNPRG